MRIEPIYLLPVITQEDVEEVLDSVGQFQLEISKIVQSNFLGDVRKLEIALNLGRQFKESYLQSIGLPHCMEIAIDLGTYRDLLSRSIGVGSEVAALVTAALKCHQRAYAHFMQGERALAAAAAEMANSNRFAKTITNEFENLSNEFSRLKARIIEQTIVAATKERIRIAQAIRNWTGPENEQLRSLKEHEKLLDRNIDSLWKYQKPIFYADFFLGSLKANYCDWLPDELLADSDCIEVLAEPPSASPEFEEFKLAIETFRLTIQAPCNELLDQETGIKTSNKPSNELKMKTGRNMIDTTLKPRSQKMSDLEIYFEHSYLKWLGLAKINRAMVNAMKDSLEGIEETQMLISNLERDPLFIALRSSNQQ